MNILDFNITQEVDAVVAATEYLTVSEGDQRSALIDLRNRGLEVMAQRLTRALQEFVPDDAVTPPETIMAFAMVQVWGFISLRPAEAKEFFRACDDPEVSYEQMGKRVAIANAMAEGTENILRVMRKVERAIVEQASHA